ncbi:hypothetical protein TTRE_0000957601 [Trichuris trichiura]|uniref:Uncharacterized protein n=1 Tax=Trichuris trichiura TaxID=36087 RepID=A0A077ZN05_TRITR|nr:hypothetical protein TTRE_0000957601 [Trichuris trichiura]
MRKNKERMQVLNDGADDEDFKELLEILKGFGEVEVLYNPDDPKDKDVTGDEVIERYEKFKKKARKNGPSTEGCIPDTTEGNGELGRGSGTNETDTTISTAA